MLDEPRLAFSFLSRIPLGGKGNVRHVPRYFTLVGYAAGAVYYAGHRWMPGDIGTIATIVIGFVLFDLFHFDGLLDTFDGFLNQSGRDKCMEIMSKGDTGPFAVFLSFFYLLALFYLVRATNPWNLVFMSVCGRFSMNVLLSTTPPARAEGLGSLMSPYQQLATFLSAAATVPLALLNWKAWALAVGVAIVTGLFMGVATRHKIGGYTGDVLGATCLLAQTFALGALVLGGL
jgi:adenosylcobinamide-GDP ribazoletransferase